MKRDLLFLLLILPFAAKCQFKENTKMTYILKNKNLEIHIDLPLENYNFSRFDWTGKIVSVKYKNIPISTIERTDIDDDDKHGKGFYNEFGIEIPVGYDEAKAGAWFPKIGVGLLKKEGEKYLFTKNYEISPAEFKVLTAPDKLIITCQSPPVNGYSYVLKKEIELTESGFIIRYLLRNTGEKIITTNEYVHNFLAINNELIGSSYILKFLFPLNPELFDATVNQENKVEVSQHEITFNGTPTEQFFFSNLTGNQNVDASWELLNTKNKIGISETGNFKTTKVNLWGWKHVISPELFFDINVKPGKEIEWYRAYNVFEID